MTTEDKIKSFMSDEDKKFQLALAYAQACLGTETHVGWFIKDFTKAYYCIENDIDSINNSISDICNKVRKNIEDKRFI